MTPPVSTEALDYVRDLIRQSLKVGAPGVAEPAREAIVRSIFLKINGMVIQPLLSDKAAAEADLQRVTAERDEAMGLRACVKFLETEWSEATDRHEAAVREQHHLEEKLDAQRRARRTAEASLATANAELARLRAEGEAMRAVLTTVKEWIDTDLPAGTSRAGTVHRVITKALEPTALARAATAREGQADA